MTQFNLNNIKLPKITDIRYVSADKIEEKKIQIDGHSTGIDEHSTGVEVTTSGVKIYSDSSLVFSILIIIILIALTMTSDSYFRYKLEMKKINNKNKV